VNLNYTTDWLANTRGLNNTRVGNCARSMWVAPEGVIYTASMWDENEGGVAIYSGGANAGSIGVHNEFQGGAITGTTTKIFAALQYNTSLGGSGFVGRYDRVSKARDLVIAVSATTTERRADVITGLASWSQWLAASDLPGNRVRIYNTSGVWQLDIPVNGPGALAFDRNGNICVAQKAFGLVSRYNRTTGALIDMITLDSAARPAALYFDPTTQYLWIGDEGPDQNIKQYNISSTPVFVTTFGVTGGYLDTTTGIKGQVGSKRFTRVHGIGKDSAGNLYVLNNPWGGTWDLGRDGGTDIHSYSAAGNLQWTLQSVNFEGVAAPDQIADGTFYGGCNVYSGTAGGTFVANTIDPFTYPGDPRINLNTPSRGEHFGQVAAIGSNRILVACGQNPDGFELFHFTPTGGYIAVPDGVVPGLFSTARVRHGYCLAPNGDLWIGFDKTGVISRYPLASFDANGKPTWGAAVTYPIPASIGLLTRIIYLPDTDTLILASGIGTDWTSIGTRVEVYSGWLAGNRTPMVITLSSTNPKAMAAAGNYLFVGYVHTVPNIDAFNLTTGALDNTFINANSSTVDVGNDVDSMYGLCAFLRSTGEYVVTKDNYNDASVIVHRWTP